MATFGVFDQPLQLIAPVFTPVFNLVTLMSPTLYTTESGDNLIHRYEIGGVVFNSFWEMTGSTLNDVVRCHDSVIAQRLDNSGAPVGEFAVGLSVEPIGVNDETELPTHVYHSRDAILLNSTAEAEDLLYSRPQDRPTGPVSIKIRRALDDYTGLFLQAYVANITATTNVTVQWSAWGQVYFRSRT